ncbi:hypothetical protein [Pseudoalteromonas luteoviolacea]|uniref:Uncharacterized protein n=1 Tax=Pseudoalteromonas luteoviolacea S4060-1 TaxID=1365257 RepID=A0A167IMG1_9GAMM|nr:hypothetical protein [Pseudoalteromonas luteoviolacea]KZN59720.1 hypothetical protein N478_08355 [Pseudoalteromonas luteoviolacea S4060-1]
MAGLLRKTLKSFFRRGAKPTESQFAKLIDACVLHEEDGICKRDSGIEITENLIVKGSLIVDGTFWLAAPPKSANKPSEDPNLDQAPMGAIYLWFGEELPGGFGVCDGKEGRPLITAPNHESGRLNYIIRLAE